LIASTVKAVIGQRLVRRLCMICRQNYVPPKEEVDVIVKSFGLGGPQGLQSIHLQEERAISEGLGGQTQRGTDGATIVSLWKANPEGCEECNHTGFKGRIGIYEVLGNTLTVQKLIVANATSNQIQDQAISEGMITMQTDGLIKALRGDTTVAEVLRVTKE